MPTGAFYRVLLCKYVWIQEGFVSGLDGRRSPAQVVQTTGAAYWRRMKVRLNAKR